MDLRNYYTPTNGIEQVVRDKTRTLVMYLHRSNTGYHITAFIGRRGRPELRYRSERQAERDAYAAQWITEQGRMYAEHAERKRVEREDRTVGAKEFAAKVRVGDLFIRTISYTMTLNTFYQILGINGRTLTVAEIPAYQDGDGWTGVEYARRCADVAGLPTLTAKINGHKRISVDGGYAYLTDESTAHPYNHLD